MLMTDPGDFLHEAEARGYIFQCTDTEGLREAMRAGPIAGYIGFDCTADSLHVGHMIQIMMLRLLQKHGHKPVAILGGGTTRIGDPSFREEARQLLTEEQIALNMAGIRDNIAAYLRFGEGPSDAIMVNNADWLDTLGYIDLLREVGVHFSVNRMLSFDSVRSRLEREQGLTFLEFNYSILQAYDFRELNRRYGVVLQMGGSDQWGNIVAGVDLIRRSEGAGAHALTFPLITKSDGTKYGKTEGGAIWLDADKMSVFHYYQFWLTAEDADVVSLLKIFTFLSRDEIEDLEASTRERPAERRAQRVLAEHVTTLTHGREAMERARHLSELLFQGQVTELSRDEVEDVFEGVPTVEIGPVAARDIQSVLVATGASPSRRQAREDIQAGAIHVNGTRMGEVDHVFSDADLLHGRYLIIRRGRRNYFLARLGD